MERVEVFRLNEQVSLIDLAVPVPGFGKGMVGTYVIHGQKVALVDIGPAVSVDNLFHGLEQLKVAPGEVRYILITHIHLDHAGGLAGALQGLPNATVIVHEKGIKHLVDPEKLWESSQVSLSSFARGYGRPQPVERSRLAAAGEGLKLDLEGIELEVLLTPGHASHHIVFWELARRRLFVGEALGVHFEKYKIARLASPLPFDLRQTFASLEKLAALEPRELYFTHFGPAFEPAKVIRKLREQLVLWGKVVARHLDDGADWRLIMKEIQDLDEDEKRIYLLPPEDLERELFYIEHDILGYREYLKKVIHSISSSGSESTHSSADTS
jgi:glyoxylase-like metal-dependent hydrolase (beta-lactamase superfamily II)